MKKIFIAIAIILAIIVGAAILIPVIFKDEIRDQISQNLDKSLNAEVYFDFDKFNLSMFSHFPNPTASLSEFGIVGKEEFKRDTLADIQSFDITIDLFSLFGDQIKIKSIYLNEPRIYVKVLEDGTANYDIAVESEEETVDSDTTSSDVNIGIDHWEIMNGQIIYEDRSTDLMARLYGVDHEGSGDFTLSVFDMVTNTSISSSTVEMEGVQYLSGHQLQADLTMLMDLDKMRFEFKDNLIKVNDLPLAFSGFFAMPEDDMDMDISFSSPGASIRSIYSLVPGVYIEGFEDVQAEGALTFEGFLRGKLTEEKLPAFQVKAQASNGRIQYPDLPSALENISLDMMVDNPDGVVEHTMINIKQFHVDFGSNPFDMKLLIKNLIDYDMEADLKGSLNLQEITQFYPVEGLEMRGLFNVDFQAEGVYDSVRNIIPSFKGNMSMNDGYVKSTEFPEALNDMHFTATTQCVTGKMEDATLKVDDFTMIMDEEEFKASLTLNNFVDYAWDLSAKGTLNLGLISDLYPIEGMTYSGKLVADIETRGKYSDVEAERYDQFPTKGEATLTDFEYKSEDLPKPFKISTSSVSFDPQKLNITECIASAGASDFNLQGYIDNYIDYTFQDNALLHGRFSMRSKVIDLNEWMTGEETNPDEPEDVDTTAFEVIEVPENLDITFTSSIDRIYYDKLVLRDARGDIIVENGILDLKGLQFDLLGGHIVMNGVYDTKSFEDAAFSYDLNIRNLSIPASFQNFTTIKAFAPMAALMDGDFSTDFKISGLLGSDMMPLLETLQGSGLINIDQAMVKQSKLVSGINSLTKMDLESENMTLKEIVLSASIEDGRAKVKPFTLNLGGNEAVIAGSIGIDGSLDYALSTEIETGQYGQAVNNVVSDLLGSEAKVVGDKMNLTFNIGGTYKDPKINLASAKPVGGAEDSGVKATVKEEKKQIEKEIKETVTEQKEEIKSEAQKELNEAMESLKEGNEEELKKQAEELKKGIDTVKAEDAEKAIEDAKKNLQDFFKRKKKN